MPADETGVPNNIVLCRWNDGATWHTLTGVYQLKIKPARFSKYDGTVQEPGSPRCYIELLLTDLTEFWEMLSHTTATHNETDAQLEITYTRKSGPNRKATISNVIFVGTSEVSFGNKGGLGDKAKDAVAKVAGEIYFSGPDDTIGNHVTTVDA